MKPSKLSSGNVLVSRNPAATGSRPGKIDDKATFAIICVAAICIAAAALIVPRLRPKGRRQTGFRLECPNCNKQIIPKTPMARYEKCSECDVSPRQVIERKCGGCDEKVLYIRMRLTKRGEEQYEQMMASAGEGGPPMMGMMAPGEMMTYDQDVQYWVQQDDGNYGWSASMNRMSPEATAMQQQYTCPNCGKTHRQIYEERRKK
jgi:hypothetical protein